MLHDEIDAPGERSADDVRQRYEAELADAVASVGTDRVSAETGLDSGTVAAIEAGDAADLDVADAAAVLALADGTPDAEAILAGVRERLLLEMSGAMLDVETLASALDGDLDAKEVQAKVEGRLPMTIAEYAALHLHAARRTGR